MNHYAGKHSVPEQVSKDLADLRAVTREAHEAIKDARAMAKQLRALHDEIAETLAISVNDMIAVAVNVGLNNYQSALQEAIDTAQDSVMKRFETIYQTLIGNTREGQREGWTPLDEIADAIAEKRLREGATNGHTNR